MKRSAILAISILFVLEIVSFGQTQQAARGRIEGVVVQAGTSPPQPVVGARITVTKVNASTGATFLVPGRTGGTSLTTGGITPFPGMAPAGQRGGATPPGPPVQQTALPIPPVTTDRGGKFVVPDLDEGAYRLLVTQNGYVRQEYANESFLARGH